MQISILLALTRSTTANTLKWNHIYLFSSSAFPLIILNEIFKKVIHKSIRAINAEFSLLTFQNHSVRRLLMGFTRAALIA